MNRSPSIPDRSLLYRAKLIGLRARTEGEVDEDACVHILSAARVLASPEQQLKVYQPLLSALTGRGSVAVLDAFAGQCAAVATRGTGSATKRRVLISLAEIAAFYGKPQDSLGYLEVAEHFPDRTPAHQHALIVAIRGVTHFLQGELKKADGCFTEALALVGGEVEGLDTSARANWALVLVEQGAFEKGRELLTGVIASASFPTDLAHSVVARSNLAVLEFEAGNSQAAATLALDAMENAGGRNHLTRAPAGIYGLSVMDSDPAEAERIATGLRHDECAPLLGEDASYTAIFLSRMEALEGQYEAAQRRLEQMDRHYATRDFFCHARIQLEQARLLGTRDREAGLALAREVRGRAADAEATLLLDRSEALIRELKQARRSVAAGAGTGASPGRRH